MTLYNPFRPHIVRLYSGKYAVRSWRFSYLGWAYFDNQRYGQDTYWWSKRCAYKWAVVDTLEKARELLTLSLFASRYDTGKYIES